MARGPKKRLFHEYLNANFGYFYTIRKTLYHGRTRFQKINLIQSDEFGTTLQLDGITQVVEKDDSQYHEPMVHPAMCSHPNPRSVLVIHVETIFFQCARAILRSDLWNPERHVAADTLPSIGTVLSDLSDGAVGGADYDREWWARAKDTLY